MVVLCVVSSSSWFFLFFLSVPGGAAPVMITEFCPNPYLHDDTDEYLVISGQGTLDGITISDEKSGFRFPPGTGIAGDLTIARNGTAFTESHGYAPDYEWQDSSPIIPDVVRSKTLHSLRVYEKDRLIQKVSWPGDVKPREGQVHALENGVLDPCPLILGPSRFRPAEFHDVAVTAFASPDSPDAVFDGVIGNATRELLVNVYEFSNPSMADALVSAHTRGVRVEVLVEGGPVGGGIGAAENAALWRMNRSGIPVYAMASGKGVHAPYRYNHAKYVVADRTTVLVVSENFKYSGFAPKGMSGNRGWGVVLSDPGAASYFASVFLTDLRSPSVIPYAGKPG